MRWNNGVKVLRILFYIIFILGGTLIGYRFALHFKRYPFFADNTGALIVASIAIGGMIGFLLAPILAKVFLFAVDGTIDGLRKLSPYEIFFGTIGLVVGLVVAALLINLFFTPLLKPLVGIQIIGQFIQPFVVVLVTMFFVYLGVFITVQLPFTHYMSKGNLKNKFRPLRYTEEVKILDTSVVIDGRVADICATGFLEGNITIPKFVLDELQTIADSSDVLKRNRGRRGLDVLNRMRKELSTLEIYDEQVEGANVDAKLVKLAKQLNAAIVTNDFNLNKVAEFQGIKILNINELANALKPVVLPGEDIEVKVLKEGKEPGQGIGYLDDGTMIVVEGGRRLLGENITVQVTSILQTAAGKMIFTKLK